MKFKMVVFILIYLLISIGLGTAGFFYFGKGSKMAQILWWTEDGDPYPSVEATQLPGSFCGGLWKCNGTASYTCKGAPGQEVCAVVSANSYNGGPCCKQCAPDGIHCSSQASCGGSSCGVGSAKVSGLDCACGGMRFECFAK